MGSLKQFVLGAAAGLIMGILLNLVLDYTPEVKEVEVNEVQTIQVKGTIDNRPVSITITGSGF